MSRWAQFTLVGKRLGPIVFSSGLKHINRATEKPFYFANDMIGERSELHDEPTSGISASRRSLGICRRDWRRSMDSTNALFTEQKAQGGQASPAGTRGRDSKRLKTNT